MIALHPGAPPQLHDLGASWAPDPIMALLVGGAAGLYALGRSRGRLPARTARRDICFLAGLLAVAAAVLSPLDTMAGALASAHMVQHLLLVVVAAPLLALSAPGTALMRGAPAPVRRGLAHLRVRARLTKRSTDLLRRPGPAWLLHVATIWFWHGSVPYQAALEHQAVHWVEHAAFLLTGVLLWSVVLGSGRHGGVSPGFAVLVLFATAMQGVFLSALLTFSRAAWYPAYSRSTAAWGLTPLEDQQLAGALMWVPGGVVYVGAALLLLARWVADSEPVSAEAVDGSHARDVHDDDGDGVQPHVRDRTS